MIVVRSSQFAEPLWIDPGLKSGISARVLISAEKKKKRKEGAGEEWMVEHSPKILASGEEAIMTAEPPRAQSTN